MPHIEKFIKNEGFIKKKYPSLIILILLLSISFKGSVYAQGVSSTSCRLFECGQNQNDQGTIPRVPDSKDKILVEVIKPVLQQVKGNQNVVEKKSNTNLPSSIPGTTNIVEIIIMLLLVVVIPLVIIPFILKNLPLLLGATGLDLSSTQKGDIMRDGIGLPEENTRIDKEDLDKAPETNNTNGTTNSLADNTNLNKLTDEEK